MPIYEYYCKKCDYKEEKIHEYNLEEKFECPVCGNILERQFPRCHFKFNCKGFHGTDYGKKGPK